jgi:hypothetical protein
MAGDGVNDVQPSRVVGAGEAASRKRWEFLTTVQFTRVPGGTATSFNALATF